MSRALITGITGQDGSYLAEHLLALGYEVHGIVRRVALEDARHRLSRLENVLHRIHLHAASLESFPSLYQVINKVQPDELYHLAAQSFVSYSFDDAFSTFRTNIDGTHYVLESVKQCTPTCRVYFAGSSEMFGNTPETPQRETTRFMPRSPYGISKLTGYELSRNYREAYGMFVTRKISSHVAAIKKGQARQLPLGNLDAKRDWGFAGDYVKAMHLMLQQPMPQDYVVATGETHSVREFCELAFARAGLNWQDYVVVDQEFYRPAEVHLLLGDASKARTELGWQPTVTFRELVHMMVDHDLGP